MTVAVTAIEAPSMGGSLEQKTVAGTDKVPVAIAACLSPDQIGLLERMLAARTAPHPIDYRVSTSLFGRSFYVALFAGTEARSPYRLHQEKQVRPVLQVLRDAFVVTTIVTLVLCLLAGTVVGAMYLLNWPNGINPFHQ